jgi:membrane associated rhomboid family serine protease
LQPPVIPDPQPTLAQTILLIAVFSAVVLAFINILRLIASAMLHRTIRRALDSDPSRAAPLIERLTAGRSDSGDDSRLSTILVAIGVAMIAASVVIGDQGWMHYGVAAALFPLVVGTALWLRLFILERARRRADSQ